MIYNMSYLKGDRMRFERVTNTAHDMYSGAMALYRASFPFHEKRERKSQSEILNDKDYNFTLAYDENDFVGMVLYWETKAFIYIEHFCVSPEKRNMRYGQKVLEALRGIGKTVILEIDPPVDEVSERRQGFYERNGFCANIYAHTHPPYHREHTGHRLVVMSCPDTLSEDEYRKFDTYLKKRVMKDAF